MMKKIFIYILTFTLPIMLLSCGISTSMSDRGDVIKIGVFEPMTGKDADNGMNEVYGIRYASNIYDKITLADKEYTIELVEVDTMSDEKSARDALKELVDENVDIVIGPYGSDVAFISSEEFYNSKIPTIVCSSTNTSVTNGNPYCFRTCFINPFESTVLASYIKKCGYNKISIIGEDDPLFIDDVVPFFKKACEKYEIEIITNEKVESDEMNFENILSRIKDASPQLIYVSSSSSIGEKIVSVASEMNIDIPVAGTNTWETKDFIEKTKNAAMEIIFTSFYETDTTKTDEETKFLSGDYEHMVSGFPEYLSSIGLDKNIHPVSALSYDAYLAAYKAIELSGSTDKEGIRDALTKVSFIGVTGEISFSDDHNLKKNTAYIKTINDGNVSLAEKISID